MKRFLFTFICALIVSAAVNAKDMLTFEQARDIALQEVPGTIIDTERSIHNGAVVYEFDIKTESGVVMDIEIDSVTHEILRLVVDEMAMGSSLPEPSLEESEAQKIAVEYIEKNTSGLRRVDVISSDYSVKNNQLVYTFDLRRGISNYRIIMDANSGRISDFIEK